MSGSADVMAEVLETPMHSVQEGMRERVDDILMANSGDARAAIEGLLLYADTLSESISAGYIRSRLREALR